MIAALPYLLWRAYSQWGDPNREYKLVNFLAAWYPFAVSVFIAFIPDFEKFEKFRRWWRVLIVILGLFYSGILWYQQSVNVAEARTDQQNAIQQSNRHADAEFSRLKLHMDTEMTKSRSQLSQVQGDLTNLVNGMTLNLDRSIEKIGKPTPQQLARLEFGFWKDTSSNITLLPTRTNITLGKGDSFSVGLTAHNITDTAAKNLEIWIQICKVCTFAKEPAQFVKEPGSDSRVRHRVFGLLNAGVAISKMDFRIAVKSPTDLPFPPGTPIHIGAMYACENCQRQTSWQDLQAIIK